MKGTRHSEEQIIAILKQGEAGLTTAELCRQHGISEQTYYRWKAKYGGMDSGEAKRLKQLEDENRNVWSAALSQAKNDGDRLVCANVYGLCWSTRLLAMMECAALSSYLVRQPGKAFPDCRFRECRVRPLCHLIVRQQTWQKSSVVAAGL